MAEIIQFIRPLSAVSVFRGDAQIIPYIKFETKRQKRAKAEEKANQAAGKVIFDNYIHLLGWEH